MKIGINLLNFQKITLNLETQLKKGLRQAQTDISLIELNTLKSCQAEPVEAQLLTNKNYLTTTPFFQM